MARLIGRIIHCSSYAMQQRFPLSSMCTITSKLHGFLRKLGPFPSPKSMHSLHQSRKSNKPVTTFYTNNHKKKPTKNNVSSSFSFVPREYMRNVIGNIYKTLKFSNWDSAQKELENLQLRWDSYTVNQVLKSHPPLEKAWLFFNWASRVKGFKHDQYTYTTMLDIFGEAGRISSMKHVFQEMVEKGIKVDSVTYTSMMHWLSSYGNLDEALKVWEEMKSEGCYPTVVSYTAFMKILFDNDRVKEATLVYKEMLQSGCVPNCYTYTILMEYLIGSGKCKEAHEIFERMQDTGVQPDKAACNILIERCSKVGETVLMTQILQYMKENRLVLRHSVFVEALKAFKIAGVSEALLRQVNPQFYMDSGIRNEANDCNKNSADSPTDIDKELLFVLIKKRNVVGIDHLLAGMMHKKIPLDHKVISAVIEVYCDHCRPRGGLLAFKYSVKMGISIDRTGYLALIGLLTRSNMFPKLFKILKEMNRAGHSLGIYLASLLIYRLGCAKQPTFAMKIFNLLPENHKCTATYTALISTYLSAKRVNQALETYKIMCRKGCSPVLGTYNVLIAGLERNGRYSAAEPYKKAKKNLHANGGSQGSVRMEEKICNLLFAADVLL